MGPLLRLICGFRGHENYLHFEANRVCLQCVACGHESPGWTVESRRPAPRFRARRAGARDQSLLKQIA